MLHTQSVSDGSLILYKYTEYTLYAKGYYVTTAAEIIVHAPLAQCKVQSSLSRKKLNCYAQIYRTYIKSYYITPIPKV